MTDPSAFLHALQSWLVAKGLKIHAAQLDTIGPSADGVVLGTAEGDAQFDYTALCAGVHFRALAEQCGDTVPLEAERGYHLMYPWHLAPDIVSGRLGRAWFLHDAQGIRVAGTVELAGLGAHKHQVLMGLLHFSSRRALPGLGEPTARPAPHAVSHLARRAAKLGRMNILGNRVICGSGRGATDPIFYCNRKSIP